VRALAGELVGALAGVDADLSGEPGRVSFHGPGEGDVVAGLDGVGAFPGTGQLHPDPVSVRGADPEHFDGCHRLHGRQLRGGRLTHERR